MAQVAPRRSTGASVVVPEIEALATDALAALEQAGDAVIVIDRERHLKGVIAFQQLIFNEPEADVVAVMNSEPHYFYTDDEAESALDAFEKYDLIEAPVLNLHRQVVGRITIDAVVDEMNEKAQSDSLRQRGLSQEEDLFAPVMASARNRAICASSRPGSAGGSRAPRTSSPPRRPRRSTRACRRPTASRSSRSPPRGLPDLPVLPCPNCPR